MLRLSRDLPWEQVHALQGGWELLSRSRRQELPPSKLFLQVGLSFHTGPVLALALSESVPEADPSPAGWALHGSMDPTALWDGHRSKQGTSAQC